MARPTPEKLREVTDYPAGTVCRPGAARWLDAREQTGSYKTPRLLKSSITALTRPLMAVLESVALMLSIMAV